MYTQTQEHIFVFGAKNICLKIMPVESVCVFVRGKVASFNIFRLLAFFRLFAAWLCTLLMLLVTFEAHAQATLMNNNFLPFMAYSKNFMQYPLVVCCFCWNILQIYIVLGIFIRVFSSVFVSFFCCFKDKKSALERR